VTVLQTWLASILEGSRDLLGNALGVTIARLPPALARNPEAELSITLDLVLSHYQQRHNDIRFLQVGAFDGVSGDPIYPLVDKYRLKGTLVEPQRDAFQKLKENYARFEDGRFALVNAAIGAQDGTAALYRIKPEAKGPQWLHQLASFDKTVILRHAGSVPNLESLIEVERVPCLTFSTLLRTADTGKVDLLQIDAEGHDAELLKLFDVGTRKPAIVRFEHKHLKRAEYDDCVALLIREGYSLARCGFDSLAYRPYPGP
jgi:FkbM family methyltransferase